jgi:hypothetical protein
MIKRTVVGYLIGWAISIALAHVLRKTAIYREASRRLAVAFADELERRAGELR